MRDTTPPNSKESYYLPELDTLRFLAFLSVYTRHALPDTHVLLKDSTLNNTVIETIIDSIITSTGYGVDFFFVLSSYLITTLLVKEYEKFGNIDVIKFYMRRGLRIWPLYFLIAFSAGLILPNTFSIYEKLNTSETLGLLTFTHNWAIAFSDTPTINPTAVFWSVSLEEQFYLVWPLLICFFKIHRLATISITLFLISTSLKIYLSASGTTNNLLGFSTILHMEPIAIGSLLAVLKDRLPTKPSTIVTTIITTTGIAIPIICMLLFKDSIWRNTITLPLCSIGFAGIIYTSLHSGSTFLKNKKLAYLGKISYGLYLYHLCVLYLSEYFKIANIPFSQTAISLVVTIIISHFSYIFYEKHFLNLKTNFTRIKSRPA